MTAPGRNSPWPCGSGKRYKDCHGELRGASDGTPAAGHDVGAQHNLHEAEKMLRAGDVASAEALSSAFLAAHPDHPEGLRVLADCRYERGAPEEGLRLLLRAARALPAHALPPQQQFGVWTALNFMFTQSLAGFDSVFASRLREDYRTWRTSLVDTRGARGPCVTAVVVVPDLGVRASAALESVFGQTYRNIDLVVVHTDRYSHENAVRALQRCPFPHRLLAVADANLPTMINAGVRASRGAFVNVLHADDRFAEKRIATLVRDVANRGMAWGFTGVGFVDGDDRPFATGRNARVDHLRQLLNAIPESDAVGYTLIHQAFVAVSESNLFFSCALFDSIGGFRESARIFAWDFALRALAVRADACSFNGAPLRCRPRAHRRC